MMTARPQVLGQFKLWRPQWIQPTDKRNRMDMYNVLHRRLKKQGKVAESDLREAAKLMLKRSMVREGKAGMALNNKE